MVQPGDFKICKTPGIQKIKKYYVDGRTLKLAVVCEAGERHHDNAGGSRKHPQLHLITLCKLGKALRKVGEDIEQIIQSYQKFHPAWVEGW
jgi:hypothetical protein